MIDWERVSELIDEIGAEDFGEVVELFLDAVDNAIQLLANANGDAVVIEEQMHFLKGAALNLGFGDLAKLCMKGEKAASEGNPDAVSANEVRVTYEGSRTMFEADLPSRLAA